MSGYLIVLFLLIGGFCGWGCTYIYFKRDKVRAKIAAEVKAKL